MNPLIDTNLILFLVIGSVDNGNFISASKRVDGFTYDDFKKLTDYIARLENFALTPYIITEVSNLIDLDDQAGDEAYRILKAIVHSAEIIDVDPKNDINHPAFEIYGVTDVNILQIAQTRPIVTNDNRLADYAYRTCPIDNIITWYLLKHI